MPSVSSAQHNAMEAAAHGRSTLGIPASVGKEFVVADAFDEGKHPRAADGKFGSGSGSAKSPELAKKVIDELPSIPHEDNWLHESQTGKYSDSKDEVLTKDLEPLGIKKATEENFGRIAKYMFSHKSRMEYKKGALGEVDLSNLLFQQRSVNKGKLKYFIDNYHPDKNYFHQGEREEDLRESEAPAVLLYPDGTAITSDNHRLMACTARGDKTAIARIYKVELDDQQRWRYVKPKKSDLLPTTRADSIDASGHEHGADGKFTGEGAGYTPQTTKILRQTGKQLGSNPGGQYHDMLGNKFYVKASKSAEHAANEILAGHLYKAAGAPITQAHAIEHEGKPGTISHWAEHDKEKFDPDNEDDRFEARDHFAAHAWLGNWDAIGLDYDNQVPIGGKLHTVDAGGAMKFRAQGTPKGDKLWGPEVHELKSMRDPSLAPQAAKVFGNISQSHLKQSAERVKNVPDNVIEHLCQEHGYGAIADRLKQADLLIARKHDLLKKTGHI